MKLRIIILKYHSWYLCQISLQIIQISQKIRTSERTNSNNRINNFIANNNNNSKQRSTDGKFDDFTSESLKNQLTTEDGSDSESVAVEG